ncbi:MAG TPA: Fic family protein [Gammaproteobacteria bacterium]|nr:Fic family protein [Gammaproteobacteria bacterium]
MKIPLTPPTLEKILKELPKEVLPNIFGQNPLIKGTYIHWDKLRHLPPPSGQTAESWWAGIKLARSSLLKSLTLKDKYGAPLQFSTPEPVLKSLHKIDKQAAGHISMNSPIATREDKDRYLVSSLIEESITSSLLEGAATTREVAKQMLRSGRKPNDTSERMILNNYAAMLHIQEIRDTPLSLELILELHSIVTRDTLEKADGAGRLRRPDEEIHVVDSSHSQIIFTPPRAEELQTRLEQLCLFANEGDDSEPFVHPVIRAILLHFMIGYIHPFVDGNGRTARAIFYWCMAKQGYWLMEYLSISRLLFQAPAQYSRAYLYTETDGNDTTYFILHQLDIILRAIDALYEYLARKVDEQQTAEEFLRKSTALGSELNYRQVALLGHALKHAGYIYTMESHKRSHSITYETARRDLLKLAEIGFLEKDKRGKSFIFFAPKNLRERVIEKA